MTSASSKMNSPLMIPQALAATLELLMNKVLSLTSAHISLANINQKTLSLQLSELGFTLSFTVSTTQGNNTLLVTSLTKSADCTIHTSLKTLAAIKANQPLTELIKQDKLDVSGDIKVAQQFANVLQNLAIDWPSELANHLGDIPTYKLQQLGKKIHAKLGFAKQQIQADAGEYIVHEQRLVASKSEIEKFNQEVNHVQQQTVKLEARISRLTKQLQR